MDASKLKIWKCNTNPYRWQVKFNLEKSFDIKNMKRVAMATLFIYLADLFKRVVLNCSAAPNLYYCFGNQTSSTLYLPL